MKLINVEKIPWMERKSPKGRFHRYRRDIALAFKSPKTGPRFRKQPPFEVELVRMPPGATNCPFHSHASEWEFYLIVSGTATMRAGKKRVRLGPGDCVMSPPGEPHHMVNTGKKDLLYYVIANNSETDVWHYPDSNKWGSPAIPKNFRLKVIPYYEGEE